MVLPKIRPPPDSLTKRVTIHKMALSLSVSGPDFRLGRLKTKLKITLRSQLYPSLYTAISAGHLFITSLTFPVAAAGAKEFPTDVAAQ